MSTNSELRVRLERLGPVRDADPPPSHSGRYLPIALRRIGPFSERIAVAQRLRAAGLTLKEAHVAISRLAEWDHAVCSLPEETDLAQLGRDLSALDVQVGKRRAAASHEVIAAVRARHGLTQHEFADLLGFDVRTLQNWEQGRNRPDAAAINLVLAYDRSPALIEDTVFEPVV